jgi:hypothetical protein
MPRFNLAEMNEQHRAEDALQHRRRTMGNERAYEVAINAQLSAGRPLPRRPRELVELSVDAPNQSSAARQFVEKVEQYERTHKVSRCDALNAIAMEFPMLARAYRNETRDGVAVNRDAEANLFVEKVVAYEKENRVGRRDALNAIALQHPDLARAYRLNC